MEQKGQEQQQAYLESEAPLQSVESHEAPAQSAKSEAWEWIKALVIAGGLVILIRWLIFAPFIVEGPSMEPNFYTGERLIVNKLIYHLRKPERGEVLVFHATEEKDYIKRVVALPGETVKVEGDKVYVNGQELDMPYLKEAIQKAQKSGHPYNTINFAEAKVPEGTIFVMGDNRSNSLDSRSPQVGFVKYEKVVGRADLIFWPLGKMSFVHF